jgi:hypothetical protein
MKDSFPVSRIDNELDALSGAEWFNVLDLQRCYFQVICDKTTVKRPHLLLKMGVINLKSCLHSISFSDIPLIQLFECETLRLLFRITSHFVLELSNFNSTFSQYQQFTHGLRDRISAFELKRPHLLLKMGVINLKSCLWDYVSHQLRLRDL